MRGIYDYPNWQVGALFGGASCVLTCLAILATRPLIPRWLGPEPAANELVSYFVSAFGVFHGLMLGLIAVGTYEIFVNVEEASGRESAALGTLHRDVPNLPEPARTELQDLPRQQCRFVAEEAWPSQRLGMINDGGAPIVAPFSLGSSPLNRGPNRSRPSSRGR